MSKTTEEFKGTVQTLFQGLDSYVSSKTVVGEPIHIGDTIILPLVNVSLGLGAGVFDKEKSNNGGGGMGCKMVPSAVLVINNGSTRLINIQTHTGMDKLLDMLPDFVDRVSKDKEAKNTKREEAAKKMAEIIEDAVDDVKE